MCGWVCAGVGCVHRSPVFGAYVRVDSRAAFAALVKDAHEHVHIVAHLYENVSAQPMRHCITSHLIALHPAQPRAPVAVAVSPRR